jgi:hypothetical protein
MMLRLVPDPIIVRDNNLVDMLGLATLKALDRVPDWKNLAPMFHEMVRPYFATMSANLSVPASNFVTLGSVNKVTLAYVQWLLDRHVISAAEAMGMLELVSERSALSEVLSPRMMRALGTLTIAQLCREEPECLFVIARPDGRSLAQTVSFAAAVA